MQHRMVKDISDFIFLNDPLKKADAIFLPGGAHSEVPELGAKVFLEGYAKVIIPSGRYAINTGHFAGVITKSDVYNKDYETECDFYKDVLVRCGVPEEAIIEEKRATFTKMNAVNTRKLTDKLGINVKSAIICCKSFPATD